ncbi:GDP-L-fucose synthase [BD1-7 clade bacterium]|uniref:GDP-L-fucose synthase n=1 Tax=BD1-7 clade bacterium TaxID=2029982 RepID=A0A5S9MQH6_9GAMM|nr:GDP-L-fucose synthase [BD1-7 clade bacterium]
MHVLVIGGTGFLGYHIVHQLLQQNHQVTLFCRNVESARQVFLDHVDYHQADLHFFHKIDFNQLFTDIDAVVYAAGADERATATGDPYAFFYRENVTHCVSLLEKARFHGVAQAIVLGSIFTYLDEQHPTLTLAADHPYIQSRADQKREALALSSDSFQVNIMEIPFVFGSTPNHIPLWRNVVNYVRLATPLIVTPGGMNVMSVTSLAQAIAGALTHTNTSGALTVGDENMSWTELMQAINRHVNHKDRTITQLNRHWFTDLTHVGAYLQHLLGWQSGLNQREISKIVTLDAYYDTADIKQQLHYQGNDLEQAFADTVRDCPEPAVVNRMHKTLGWLSENSRDFVYGLDQSLQRLKRD